MTTLENTIRGMSDTSHPDEVSEMANFKLHKRLPKDAEVDKDNTDRFDDIFLVHGKVNDTFFYSMTDTEGTVMANLTYDQFVLLSRALKLKLKPKKDKS